MNPDQIATLQRRNEHARNVFPDYTRETTGIGRIRALCQYLEAFTCTIPHAERSLSIMEIGIGSQKARFENYQCALTPWFLYGYLQSFTQNPQLHIVEQNPTLLHQLEETVVFAPYSRQNSVEECNAFQLMGRLLQQPYYDIELTPHTTIRAVATPGPMSTVPWVTMHQADAATLQTDAPLQCDVVFARFVAYQMVREAQEALLANARQTFIGKPGGYFVVTDAEKRGKYQWPIFKKNGGWLSENEIEKFGFAIDEKKVLGGTETIWTDYVLRTI